MSKSFKYIVLVFLISSTLLTIVHVLYRHGYNRFHFYEYQQFEEIMNGTNRYDILFFGSSRTRKHINPRIIDSIVGLSSFNAGILGANLYEMDLILKCYLNKHKPPKIAVLEIPNAAFAVSLMPLYNPNPYYQHLGNTFVFQALKPYKRAYLYRYLPFSQLSETSEMLRQQAVLGYLGKKAETALIHYKGYSSYTTDTLKLPLTKRYETQNYQIEKKGVEMLKEIIALCKKNNVSLVIMYTPVYKKGDEPLNEKLFPTIEKLCQENRLPFFNYRTIDSISYNHKLFFDEVHLNQEGSKRFSKIVAEELLQMIKQN